MDFRAAIRIIINWFWGEQDSLIISYIRSSTVNYRETAERNQETSTFCNLRRRYCSSCLLQLSPPITNNISIVFNAEKHCWFFFNPSLGQFPTRYNYISVQQGWCASCRKTGSRWVFSSKKSNDLLLLPVVRHELFRGNSRNIRDFCSTSGQKLLF